MLDYDDRLLQVNDDAPAGADMPAPADGNVPQPMEVEVEVPIEPAGAVASIVVEVAQSIPQGVHEQAGPERCRAGYPSL